MHVGDKVQFHGQAIVNSHVHAAKDLTGKVVAIDEEKKLAQVEVEPDGKYYETARVETVPINDLAQPGHKPGQKPSATWGKKS